METNNNKWNNENSLHAVVVAALFAMLMFFQFCSPEPVFGETTRQGNSFVQTATKRESKAKQTDYTYTSKDGQTYPIYLSANGRAFVKRVSAKSGKEYNYYLDEEVSKTICNEMGVTYVPKKSK